MNENETRNPYAGVGRAAWEKRQLIQEDYPGNLYKEAYEDYEMVLNDDQIKGLFVAMCFLEPRQRMILDMRYRDKMTTSEISEIIGVTKERIRQLEQKSLRDLRSPRLAKYVKNGFNSYIHILQDIENKKGYDKGYSEGYRQGIKDANAGKTKSGVSVCIADLPIEALSLSPNTAECLRASGFVKIEQLLDLNEEEIKSIPKLFTKRRVEIAVGLDKFEIRPEAWEFYRIISTIKGEKRNEKNDN